MTDAQKDTTEATILVIDDDPLRLKKIAGLVASESLSTICCQSAAEALLSLRQTSFSVATLNLGLSETDGLTLMQQLRTVAPQLRIIIYDTTQTLSESVLGQAKKHAFAYLKREAHADELLLHLHRGLHHNLVSMNRELRLACSEQKTHLAIVEKQLEEESRERARVQAVLNESKARFRELLRNFPNGYINILNQELYYVFAAGKGLTEMGLKPEDLISKKMSDVFPEAFVASVSPRLQEAFDGEEVEFELEFNERHYQFNAAPMQHDSGSDKLIFLVARDVTQRRRSEQAVLHSETKFRDLFESSPEAIFVHSPDGNLLDVNQAACRLHGMTRDELMRKNIRDLVPEENIKIAYNYLNQVLEQGYGYGDGLSLAKDGGRIPVEISAQRILYSDKPAILLHVHDVSSRKDLEAQLVQASKMEAVGRLAGGVAHDFNNLLTVILGNSEFGLQDTNPEDKTYQELLNIEDAALQARDLVRQLLTFSRRQDFEPKLIDMNEIIQAHLKLLRRVIGEDIRVQTRLAPDLKHLVADPSELQQILMNLCVNARDAMPNGGDLVITTQNVEEEDALREMKTQLLQRADRRANLEGLVEIAVMDTGVGMDEETQAHIFEPFFTTKEVGRSTGLGLSVVYGIVNQHNGLIQVNSKIGKGTTFKIYLPAVSEAVRAEHEEPESVPIQGAGETILVVEDDDGVLNVSFHILDGLGYHVLKAHDGIEAVKIVQEQNVDLVILDVVMPKMSGPDTYKQINQLRPEVPVLFVTGYDVNEEIDTFMGESVPVLQKPYTQDTLGQKVHEVLQ